MLQVCRSGLLCMFFWHGLHASCTLVLVIASPPALIAPLSWPCEACGISKARCRGCYGHMVSVSEDCVVTGVERREVEAAALCQKACVQSCEAGKGMRAGQQHAHKLSIAGSCGEWNACDTVTPQKVAAVAAL